MKTIKIFFLVLIHVLLVHAQNQDPFIAQVISQADSDSLVKFVRILSGEDSVTINDQKTLITHRVNRRGNDLAADYIKEKLQSYDLEVVDQEYSTTGRNIYALQSGALFPEKQVIICAHYDAVADYCADDNASGTAAVLEAARILSQYDFSFSLVYALWDEEEIGLIGSNFYASQAAANGTDIKWVINIDMIGWDSNNDGLIEIHTKDVENSPELASAIYSVAMDYQLPLLPKIFNPGATASDHSRFWQNDYSAVLMIEGYFSDDFNPYYHSSLDRIERFNTDYFFNASKLAIGSFTKVSHSDYPLDKVFPFDLSIENSFFNPGKDTIWIATEVNNPQTHNVKVIAELLGSDFFAEDSIILNDDGSSFDGDAGDNLFGSYIIAPEWETNFFLSARTTDLDEQYQHSLPLYDAVPFTTIGPVIMPDSSSGYIEGIYSEIKKQQSLKLVLKNYGQSATAVNIEAFISTDDSRVMDFSAQNMIFSNITPGSEIVSTNLFYFVYADDSGPENTVNDPIVFDVTIFSDDYPFWNSSFEYSTGAVSFVDNNYEKPTEFVLMQNYPNPFNPQTRISYNLPKSSHVELTLFNLLGQKVETLLSTSQSAGLHYYNFNAENLPAGVYLYRLDAGNFSDVKKMILIK